MPSGEMIQQHMTGAWRLMTGRSDGLTMLDLSADGFWNSFYALVISIPALGLGWVTLANELGGGEFGNRLSIFVRLAFVDFAAWIAPIIVVSLASRPLGITKRFVPYVVASNWGSALLIWALVPLSIIELIWAGSTNPLLDVLSLVYFLVPMVLSWRLTVTVVAMGLAIGSAVFAIVVATSLFILISLPPILGFQIFG